MGRKKRSDEVYHEIIKNRLMEKSVPEPNTGCLLWCGNTNNKGYGMTAYRDTKKLVHRLSFLISNGFLSDDDIVMHKCDTPACINPDHLVIGSQLDNMKDMHIKGRFYSRNVKYDPSKTCINGHPRSEENRYFHGGRLYCRECQIKKAMSYHWKNRDDQIRKMKERREKRKEVSCG